MKNYLRIILTTLNLVGVTCINGQTFQTTIAWQNKIAGSQSDQPMSISKTSDGGSIIAGYSNSLVSGDKTENPVGQYDYWVVKLDATGAIVWQNTIGGDGQDFLYGAYETPDGGYMLGGLSNSDISGDKTENSYGDSDYWIVKLNSLGVVQWDKTIGGTDLDELFSFQVTSDGGGVMGGNSYSGISGNKTESALGNGDYWVVKIDSVGNIEWQNTIGSIDEEYLYSIVQTADNGYLINGCSNGNISGDKTESSNGGFDAWILKLNSTGNIVWQNTIGGSLSEESYAIDNTSDGGSIVAISSNSNISGDKTENSNGFGDTWVIKLDATGNITWQNTIGGALSDIPAVIKQTSNGEYIIGNYSNSDISADKTENSYGTFDYWIVKIDGGGNVLWDKTLGGINGDYVTGGFELINGEYIFVGSSSSDISGNVTENTNGMDDYWVIKLLECELANLSSVNLSTPDICVGNTAGIIITGNLNDASYWYLQSDSCGGSIIDSTITNVFNVSPSDTTQYFITAQGGCVNYADTCMNVKLNVDNCLGIEEQINNQFLIYPNPASDFIKIQTNDIIKSVQLLDLTGKPLLIDISDKIIDVSKFSPAIYFIEVATEHNTFRKKIVKN